MQRAIFFVLLFVTTVFSSACGSSGTAPIDTGQQVAFGVEMARQGLWDEARFRFRQAEAHDPGNYRILNNMAVAAEALGQFEEAEELYRRALALNAGDRELRHNHDRFLGFWETYRARDTGEDEGDSSVPEDGEEQMEDNADG